MVNKKYYISLFLIMVLTIGILGMSYSKSSDITLAYNSNETNIDNSRIIYSNGNIINLNNKETNLSIINNSNEPKTYYISFINLIGSNEDLFIDNQTFNINEEYQIELSELGSNNDHKTISFKLLDNDAYKINVLTSNPNNLNQIIKNSSETYKDLSNNIRYYGDNPNNYIKYNDEIYRIVGIINNNVEIISNSTIRKNYNKEIEYLSLNEYLMSFNNNDVTIENTTNYNTWLNQENSFWLNDNENDYAYFASKYRGIKMDPLYSYNTERKIDYLSPKAIIINGNGTIDNPYEVVLWELAMN